MIVGGGRRWEERSVQTRRALKRCLRTNAKVTRNLNILVGKILAVDHWNLMQHVTPQKDLYECYFPCTILRNAVYDVGSLNAE